MCGREVSSTNFVSIGEKGWGTYVNYRSLALLTHMFSRATGKCGNKNASGWASRALMITYLGARPERKLVQFVD